MESIENKILKLVKRKPSGKILFAQDFIDIADTKRINKALERLHNEQHLLRVAKGIYTRPKEDPVIGKIKPTVEQVAQAIAKRDKARIVPTGAQALYQLGLTNQVPINVVYYTDASDRSIRIGKRKITFKKGAAKNVAFKGKISTLAIQALKSLGKEQVKPEEIKMIQNRLQEENPTLLQHDLRLAPAWVRQILQPNNKPNDELQITSP